MSYDIKHYEEHDPEFVKDLTESQHYVWRAAQWLSGMGYNVTVRPVKIRPDAKQMGEYGDDGDLEIIQRVEVKRRQNMEFTSKETYPFSTVIVDVAHTWDKANPKPYAYIIFNKWATACLIVKGSTFAHWKKVAKHDALRNRERSFYECPKDYCQFFTLPTPAT